MQKGIKERIKILNISHSLHPSQRQTFLQGHQDIPGWQLLGPCQNSITLRFSGKLFVPATNQIVIINFKFLQHYLKSEHQLIHEHCVDSEGFPEISTGDPSPVAKETRERRQGSCEGGFIQVEED